MEDSRVRTFQEYFARIAQFIAAGYKTVDS